MRQGTECRGAYLCARQDIKSSPCFQDLRSDRAFFGSDAILVQSRYLLSSVLRSLPYSMQAPALLQSHGGGVGTCRFSYLCWNLTLMGRAGDSGGSVIREGVPVGDCNDKPGSLTVTARISRSLQTPRNLPLSASRGRPNSRVTRCHLVA